MVVIDPSNFLEVQLRLSLLSLLVLFVSNMNVFTSGLYPYATLPFRRKALFLLETCLEK